MTTTAPPTDPITAQTVATALVADALRVYAASDLAIVLGGEAYEVALPVRSDPRPGQPNGLVTFHISDGTRYHAVSVTLTVAATPLGGA